MKDEKEMPLIVAGVSNTDVWYNCTIKACKVDVLNGV